MKSKADVEENCWAGEVAELFRVEKEWRAVRAAATAGKTLDASDGARERARRGGA